MRYKELLGKKIRITYLDDPYAENYIGKEGIVNDIAEDCCKDIQLWGTWGGIAIYPGVDRFEILD